ncbi:XRE family transcriptional regulator [Kiloniella litopenaei]|uniref:XRE family transcriptional regulator n=1 Tax=Kiloniella litopenaei TaxID=1549748 RepID=A0A0M2R973_9PROT|nr:XRE family transcriptional regulator [Kiloniella litopenaei]KKJ78196.1 XRE family transcriptional regulator [Kiloniella litopenaei]
MREGIERQKDKVLAARLKTLRVEKGWSLDQLADQSNVSRATLSRMEKGDVSPTTAVLGRLCAAYGMTMSRLMIMVEDDFLPLVRRDDQTLWNDKDTGFERRSVSPPSASLGCEVLECRLQPGTEIDYPAVPKDNAPQRALEHHLVLREGELEMTVNGQSYVLRQGDCLRYKLQGPNRFRAHHKKGAFYTLVIL